MRVFRVEIGLSIWPIRFPQDEYGDTVGNTGLRVEHGRLLYEIALPEGATHYDLFVVVKTDGTVGAHYAHMEHLKAVSPLVLLARAAE